MACLPERREELAKSAMILAESAQRFGLLGMARGQVLGTWLGHFADLGFFSFCPTVGAGVSWRMVAADFIWLRLCRSSLGCQPGKDVVEPQGAQASHEVRRFGLWKRRKGRA